VENLRVFQEKVARISGVRLNSGKAGTPRFIPTNTQNVKKFAFLFIPPIESVEEFALANFRAQPEKSIVYPTIGEVIEYPEQGIREALCYIPLSSFANTSYRPCLEGYVGKFRFPSVVTVVLTVHNEHPVYNFIDEGNKFISKFVISPDGSILTKMGKAGSSYQYLYFIGNDVDLSKYNDYHLMTPYKKKVKEIHSAVVDGNARYKGEDISLPFNYVTNAHAFFEHDFVSEAGLNDIPKNEVIAYSKVKEVYDSAQQILVQMTTMGDEDEITLKSGLKLKKNCVEYVGQELSSDYITPLDFLFNTKKCFPNLSRFVATTRNVFTPYIMTGSAHLDELDWDTYMESFLRYLWIKSTTTSKTINIVIGDVKIALRYNAPTSVFYINDKRINKDEVVDVMLKAICANTQESYTEALDIISKTSLEMHKFILEGLNIDITFGNMPKELEGYLTDSDIKKYMSLSFRIAREKGINYIELGSKFIKIKDSRKLMDLRYRSSQYSEITRLFGPGTTVLEEPIEIHSQMADIIEVARAKYLAAFEKSKELLAFSLKELDATVTNFKGSDGVVIRGNSGNQYFIKVSNLNDPMKGEPECTVYLYPSYTHICIVDKSSTVKTVGMDKLVARMFALKNDSFLTGEIHTLKAHVK
jgi:hypothetical protein